MISCKWLTITKLIYCKLSEKVYSAIYWKFIGRIEHVFFLQILHAEKTLAASRRARAITRTERFCVWGSKWRQMSVCVKIARALGLKHVLLLSSTVENRAHTDVWRHFACVRRSCGNDAFFSIGSSRCLAVCAWRNYSYSKNKLFKIYYYFLP